MVEAQHRVSTLKLVDDAAEQALLEDLIERAKPPIPRDAELARLHPLLATPFRYPPLRYGSRFGRRHERGLWYGSLTVATALAEVAYYRLVFLDGCAADLTITPELTAFQVGFKSRAGVDLTRPPFARHVAEISAPDHYEVAQDLGSAMRADGVEVCVYRSARCPAHGSNVAIFSPRGFAERRPAPGLQVWQCRASRSRVDFVRKNLLTRRDSLSFERATFELDGRLPTPAV